MMRRLFYLMRCWTLLSGCGFSFVSCKQVHIEEAFDLRAHLVVAVVAISCYITGKQKEVGDDGNIKGEKPFEKNFLEAHKLFPVVESMLREYPKITNHPIAQSTLKEINEELSELKSDIASLTDGQEKDQFTKEFNHLAQYLYSLIK